MLTKISNSLNLAFGLTQASVTFLEQKQFAFAQGLAQQITELSNMLVFGELVSLLIDMDRFCRLAHERPESCIGDNKRWCTPKTKITLQNIAKIAGAMAFSAALAYGLTRLPQLGKTPLDLQKFFEETVSLNHTKEAPLIKVSLTQPSVIYRFLMINSICMKFLQASISPEPWTEFRLAALKIFSVFSVQQTKWLIFERTDQNYPLKNQIIQGLNVFAVEKIKTNYHLIISSNLMKNKSYLAATLQHIYDYSERFFEESQWKFKWVVTTQNFREVSRSLQICVKSSAGLLPSLSFGQTPVIKRICGSIYAKVSGSNNFRVDDVKKWWPFTVSV